MVGAYPDQVTRWRLYSAQITESLHVVAFKKQDTEGTGCLALSRGELACRFAGYQSTLIFDSLGGKIRNQSHHQFKFLLSVLELLGSQHHICH